MTKAGFEDFRALPPIGDVPVIVLVGQSIAEWPGAQSASSDVRRWVAQWLQNRNASLHRFADGLTQGTFVTTPYSSHAIQNSEPELVAWAIDRAIHANRRH
jgi:thioredoxin-like negative regulator of GroEL